MSSSKTDLILHPIRARIIVEFSGRCITAKELAESMPDVPMTTLYRHINALAEGGILTIVKENQVRGTVERVYALDRRATDLTPEDLSQMTREDYERLVMLFITGLMGDFSSYFDGTEPGNIDLLEDGLKFGKVQLYLSNAEFEVLQTKVYEVIESVVANEPSPDRKPRIASVAFIPTQTR